MGNTAPSDNRTISPVEALVREKPTHLMARLRGVWSEVEQALQAGHTLRLIHKRLNMAGVPISYKCLVVYRGRIERSKKAHGGFPKAPLPARLPDNTRTFDPLANLRAQEQKRVVWQYPSGPPDESKLI